MKKQARKIIAILTLCLLVSLMLTVAVYATDSEETLICGEQTGNYNFTWELDTTTGILTFTPGTSGTYTKILRADKTHTALKTWKASYASQVNHIILEEGFTAIETNNSAGPAPLHGFDNLLTIKLPSTLVKFSSVWDYKGVFMSNPLLTTIYTGELTEEKIGTADLSSITTMGGNDYGIGRMFSGDKAIVKVVLPSKNSGNNKYIGDYMFNDCKALKEISIPSWATSIKSYAFYNCTSLESIEIPSSITAIEVNAFKNCSALTGASFTVGDEGASATGLVIPASVASIAAGAFTGTNLNAVKLLGPSTVIAADAFPEGTVVYCSSKDQQTALESNGYTTEYYVETVSEGSQPLSSDNSITMFSWKLNTEGTLTFTANGYDISTTNSLTAFKTWRAGIDTSLVKKIVIEGKTQYGKVHCQHYTNILSGWPSVETIHLNAGIYVIDNGWTNTGVFQNDPMLRSVYLGNSSHNAEGNINLSGITTLTHNSSKNILSPQMFYNDAAFTSITLPCNLETVGANAFYGCKGLTYIELPASVTTIGASAFAGSGVKEIRILSTNAESFTIGAGAFDDPSSVTAHVYSNAMKVLLVDTYGFDPEKVNVILKGSFGNSLTWEISGSTLTIGGSGNAFAFDSKITADTLGNIPWSDHFNSIETVVIDAPVTAVCDYALAGLSACKSIEIPSSLTDFDARSVFSGNTSLKSIFVTENEAAEGVFDLFNATAVSADLFDGCPANAEVYLPKLADTSFLDAWSTDLSKLTVCTYPTGALASTVRTKADISLTYLPESYDETLVRSGTTVGGDNFSWTYDDKTETVTFTSAGLFRIFKTNEANWLAWKNVWKDAVKHAVVTKSTVSVFVNWANGGSFFKDMKALESIHFETSANFNIRNTDASSNGLFNGCSSLKTVSFGKECIRDGVVDLSRWKTFQTNADGMFMGCSSIERIILPEVMTNQNNPLIDFIVATNMFNGCSSLKELVIPDCMTAIEAGAFTGCTALEKLVIQNPDIDLSAVNAATFPASEGLTIYVTSEKAKNAIDALGIADTKVVDLSCPIRAEGFSIRTESYNGLRGIFSFDNAESKALEALGFTLKEYGTIVCSAAEYEYNNGIELENANGTYVPCASSMKKIAVYSNGRIVNKILNSESIPNADENKTYFALSIVNYKNNFKSDIYITGYAIYTDASGNDYFSYSNYGDIAPEYKFIDLYQMTLNMYKNDATTSITRASVDETAVWNTLLQGAVEGYSERPVADGITATVVSDDDGYYVFVRNEIGMAVTENDISSALTSLAFDGSITASFGVSIPDMGTAAPEDVIAAPRTSTVTTPNRYNRAQDKAQHCQGMCTDGTHIYFSFTGKIVKVRISDGVEVGTLTVDNDIDSYNAHIGNLIYHEGNIYGCLSFWGTSKTYIIVIDADDIKGNVLSTDTVRATYYDEDNEITLFAGTENETKDRFAGDGAMLDSITVGKIPGGGFILPDGSEITDNDHYLVLGAGSAYQHPTKRHDDDYLRLRFVDFNDVLKNAVPIDSARIKSSEEYITCKYTAYAYAGATCVQVVSYDKDTGDYHFATYSRDAGLDDTYPKYDYFVVDGSKKLRLTELELGQSTPEDSDIYEISVERAAQYKDKDDLDRDGITDEQMLGWTMDIRCLCGRGSIYAHDAIDYDNSGYASRICGIAHPGMADQGLISLGNDYFYVAYYNDKIIDGVQYFGENALLYRLSRYNGAWNFKRIS